MLSRQLVLVKEHILFRLGVGALPTELSSHMGAGHFVRPYYIKWPAPRWLDSSVGRALHWYRRVHGFESRSGPRFFQTLISRPLKLCAYYCVNQSDLHIILRSSNIWTFIYSLVKCLNATWERVYLSWPLSSPVSFSFWIGVVGSLGTNSETASFAASTWLALFPAASPGGKRLSSDVAVIRDSYSDFYCFILTTYKNNNLNSINRNYIN